MGIYILEGKKIVWTFYLTTARISSDIGNFGWLQVQYKKCYLQPWMANYRYASTAGFWFTVMLMMWRIKAGWPPAVRTGCNKWKFRLYLFSYIVHLQHHNFWTLKKLSLHPHASEKLASNKKLTTKSVKPCLNCYLNWLKHNSQVAAAISDPYHL